MPTSRTFSCSAKRPIASSRTSLWEIPSFCTRSGKNTGPRKNSLLRRLLQAPSSRSGLPDILAADAPVFYSPTSVELLPWTSTVCETEMGYRIQAYTIPCRFARGFCKLASLHSISRLLFLEQFSLIKDTLSFSVDFSPLIVSPVVALFSLSCTFRCLSLSLVTNVILF
jgi:hypothetical protein